jgi:hypothetical protein
MKTICEALIDEIHYPLSKGYVENVLIKRGLFCDDDFDCDVSRSDSYRGAVADCLRSLLFSVNFSEADKSVGSISSEDKKRILKMANNIYSSIGEEVIEFEDKPKVHIGW